MQPGNTSYPPVGTTTARPMVWAALLALLLTLTVPVFGVDGAGMAAPQDGTEQEPPAQACEPGFVLDPASSDCVPEPPLESAPEQQVEPEETTPEQTTCGDGEVLDPNTGQCVPDPGQQDPETPACDEDMTLDPDSGECVPVDGQQVFPDELVTPPPGSEIDQPVALEVRKYQCPEGLDGVNKVEHGALLSGCPANTQPVLITHNGPDGSSETTELTSFASWTHDLPGTHGLAEQVPEGYGVPVVFCEVSNQPGGMLKMDVLAGNAISWDLQAGDAIACDWFNIQSTSDGNTSDLDVYKWTCPATTSFDQGFDTIPKGCDSYLDGVEFTLVFDGETRQVITDDTSGYAYMGTVPPGPWTLSESIPGGFGEPVVRCDGEGVEPIQSTAVEGTISGEFTDEYTRLKCNWFNVRDHEPNTLHIYAANCPEGAGYDTPLSDLELLCVPAPDVQFDFAIGVNSGDGLTDQTGDLVHDNMPVGEWLVAELVPEGYGDPIVVCGPRTMSVDAPIEVYNPLPNGELRSEFADGGNEIQCGWFNILATTNQIDITTYACPESTDLDTDLETLQGKCEVASGVEFRLTAGNETTSGLTDGNGSLSFADIPIGRFTLQEVIPDGYGDPIVFCPSPTSRFLPLVVGNLPSEFREGGNHYDCLWFNIPKVDGNTVSIFTYYCEPATRAGDIDRLLNACKPLIEPASFTLTVGEESYQDETESGGIEWSGLSNGPFTVRENSPDGYGLPSVWCAAYPFILDHPGGERQFMQLNSPGGTLSGALEGSSTRLICLWFNILLDEAGTVIAHTWRCPDGTSPETGSLLGLSQTCSEPMSGVEFTLTHAGGPVPKATEGGIATWEGVSNGDVSLTEGVPPGYFEPIVFCSIEAVEDAGTPFVESVRRYDVADGTISQRFDYAEYEWVCHFFNVPKGPGEITINKWTCPPGYDVEAFGADPAIDCTDATDGVTFTLTQPNASTVQSDTGDSVPGAVYFGSLDPGAYVVRETVPDGISQVFTWDCVGTDIDAVHPVPLNFGNALNIDVAGGDGIVCNWYNVPASDSGQLTVHKHLCWTATFTSEVDCDTYEHGASFELVALDGDASQGTGTTTAGGTFTWSGLGEGAYRLDEVGGPPCNIAMSKDDGDGNPWVDAGEETIVTVYNCAPESTSATDTASTPAASGGKAPTKYPNTGVGPSGSVRAPHMQDSPLATATPPGVEPGEPFFPIRCLKPGEATPDVADTPDGVEPCSRGALPERVVIDAADVDAGVETLEIIDGIMQQPTGPQLVSWYKESGRLGEDNNMLLSGHLNYWGDPEGVFFSLDQLQAGDRIEITGDDGRVYIHEVEWVRQESNLDPPALDVIGPTGAPSLTLITCGGEWNYDTAEYDERTVVRAILVDVQPAGAAGS